MGPSSPVPRQLAVASWLGYAWAAVMFLLSLAAAIPAVAHGARAAAAMALPLALSVASAASAHGIRRRRWAWFAMGAASAWIAFLVLVPLRVGLPGIAVNTVILGLVVTNLRRFR